MVEQHLRKVRVEGSSPSRGLISMWITEEDESFAVAALNGNLVKHGESSGYIQGEYCPRCGAQKVKIDFTHCYINNGYNRKVGQNLTRYLVCRHCHHGYVDSDYSRWDMRTAYSGNADLRALEPIPELLNPHNWRKNRELVREAKRRANGKKCREDATAPEGYYGGRCGFPFGHDGDHRIYTPRNLKSVLSPR